MQIETYVLGVTRKLLAVLPELQVAAAELVRNELAPYPPAPSYANRKRWYQRGYGPRWKRKDGSIGGRKSSQRLSTRWFVVNRGRVVVLQNRASYSGYVHRKDRAHKMPARIHVQRGWVQDVDAIARAQPSIAKMTENVLENRVL